MTYFTVNVALLERMSNDENGLYDRYTVRYRRPWDGSPPHERTGTIPDLLAYVLPTDIILEVTRA